MTWFWYCGTCGAQDVTYTSRTDVETGHAKVRLHHVREYGPDCPGVPVISRSQIYIEFTRPAAPVPRPTPWLWGCPRCNRAGVVRDDSGLNALDKANNEHSAGNFDCPSIINECLALPEDP